MAKERVIRKIYENKHTGQMLVGVPKDSGFVVGDYVELVNVVQKQE